MNLYLKKRNITRLKNKQLNPNHGKRTKSISDTSKYKEAALKRWANKEEREKLCQSMRVPKKKK